MILQRLLILAGVGFPLIAGAAADPLNPPPQNDIIVPLAPRDTPNTADAPRIEFTTPVHDFGRVHARDSVRHDFVFTNTGGSTLRILEVKPGCGCTTTGTWDREVEPGKSGTIPIQFNAGSFNGNVTKSVYVRCNDPARPNVYLQIKANVWTPIAIQPATAYFTMSSDTASNQVKVVRITSNLDEPLQIESAESTNETFKVAVQAVKPGKEYELHITALPPRSTATYVNASIAVKTSSREVPEIQVPATLVMQPAVSVTPSQLTLITPATGGASQGSVTIRTTSSEPLILSNPQIDLEGAQLEVNEVRPGQLYRLTLKMPADAKLPQGRRFEATVNSNHPKYPVIKVPVVQIVRHAATTGTRRSVANNPATVVKPPLPSKPQSENE